MVLADEFVWMKILWLSHLIPYPPKAGVIQRSYHLLKQLSKTNEVHLLAFSQPGLMRPLVIDLDSGIAEAVAHLSDFCTVHPFIDIPSDCEWMGKLRLLIRSLPSPRGYNLNWLSSKSFEEALVELLKRNNYDLVHMDTISFAAYYDFFSHIVTVLNHHNIESHMMRRRAGREPSWLKRAYFKLEADRLEAFEQKLCAQVDLNITCSDMDSGRLLEISPSAAVTTVPNGVDTEYYSPDRESTAKARLIFIGTMSWYPNIEAVKYIIDNMALSIQENFPHLTIDVIGAGAPEWLQDSARKFDNVTFHGFVDDIRPLMNESLAFLCPIMDGGGTKLKILDALSMSLPIICHPIACEGIDVANGETVLFAESPAQFLAHIKTLNSDQLLSERLGACGRKLAIGRYSVAAVGKLMREYYELLKTESLDLARTIC